MGKKDKKKVKGAEKTAAKTEKKALQKAKKELAAKGEDDIERLIAEFQAKDSAQNYVGEEPCSPPSPRSAFSLCAHPEKDVLLLFGGEYFNGAKTEMYNDLYFYNTKKDQWSILHCSNKPPPRCSHQSVIVSQGGGQMWVFGGEFASPTRSNFYHYKDLWVYHISERRWEQIKASGVPASRSGHRMVVCRKRLVVFGGFHESIRDYKYFNDINIFDLETYQWTKVLPINNGPLPRSSFQMASLSDGRILVYGGYSREKVKKDVDKGIFHSDMYYLQLDEKSAEPKWKWVLVKQTGIQPIPRSGFSMAVAPNNKAFLFGGVHDEEDCEEVLTGSFHNDFFSLDMERGKWTLVTLQGKTESIKRKTRHKVKENSGEETAQQADSEQLDGECAMKQLNIVDDAADQAEVMTYEDSVFTVKVGPSNSEQAEGGTCSTSASETASSIPTISAFCPSPRMNAAIAVKHGILYLYGGLYEDGDKQLTLSDFYCLDLHKMDEWKTLIVPSVQNLEWCESEASSNDEDYSEQEGSDDDGDYDDGHDNNTESKDKEMEMDTS